MEQTPSSPVQYLLNPTMPRTPGELVPLQVIRTETVLSKLPIHNLAKKGHVEIGITRRNEIGQVDLHWEVSYSSKYGAPRQLAYKVDTLVVNRRIDEERRPVPRLLRLGSLSQICADLDMPSSGRNTNNVKKAILQNAGSLVSAKLNYRTTDGIEKRLEAVFTRYSVVFTGERLPNGREADGVYLIFNEPYWEVLNNAPVRPLNYEYLKQLSPASQRFYEIVSYRMFVALKYGHPYAKLSYADYCTYSAQQRYFDYDRFKKQMYKVHRPHLQSGYISKVHYDAALDSEGRADWVMCYEPGPRARNEHSAFERRPSLTIAARQRRLFEEEDQLTEGSAGRVPVSPLVEQMVKRGITLGQALKLEQTLVADQRVLDQLEWGDYLVRQSPKSFRNPPGFYVYLIRENVSPPPHFVTSRQQLVKRETEQETEALLQEQLRYELAYDEYRRLTIDAYLQQAEHAAQFAAVVDAKEKELRKQYRSLATSAKAVVRELAESTARAEIVRGLALVSFAEFCEGLAPAEMAG